jgi:hypothetical protein
MISASFTERVGASPLAWHNPLGETLPFIIIF